MEHPCVLKTNDMGLAYKRTMLTGLREIELALVTFCF